MTSRSSFDQRLSHLLKWSYVAIDRLAWLERIDLGRVRRVLDIGTGTGALVRQVHDSAQLFGIEPSHNAAALARDKGIEVHVGTLEDFEPDDQFDLILLIHTLEHLVDPEQDLARLRKLLSTGGRLIVATPNVASLERCLFGSFWDGWDVPRHVHHFTPSSLSRLLQESGFRVEEVLFEKYSLFSRSLANRWRGSVAFHVRKTLFRCAPWETLWGFLQAILRRSSAIQIIASLDEEEP